MGVKNLNLQDILNTQDTNLIEFHVDEWGGNVFIKTLTADARDVYERSCLEKDDSGEWIRNPVLQPANFVAACLHNEHGEKMFKSPEQVAFLREKSFSVVNKIFEKCLEVNLMQPDAVEEEVKN